MKTFKINLIRCFYTEGNMEGRYIGHTDEPLCSQALLACKKMAKECEYPSSEIIFSSPLKRSMVTAQILFPENNITPMNELIECNFGEFEGKTADDLKSNEKFSLWLQGDADAAPPYGESSREFSRRICSSFTKIVEAMFNADVDKISIVTHAGVIMAILTSFGLPEAPMHEWQMQPGNGYMLNLMPSIWSRSKKAEVFSRLPFTPSN